jgi:hypothetical protein
MNIPVSLDSTLEGSDGRKAVARASVGEPLSDCIGRMRRTSTRLMLLFSNFHDLNAISMGTFRPNLKKFKPA